MKIKNFDELVCGDVLFVRSISNNNIIVFRVIHTDNFPFEKQIVAACKYFSPIANYYHHKDVFSIDRYALKNHIYHIHIDTVVSTSILALFKHYGLTSGVPQISLHWNRPSPLTKKLLVLLCKQPRRLIDYLLKN